MPNLNVAVMGSPDYAKGLGKKSTTSDITLYDLKRDDVTVSLVEPTKHPDKLASLFFAVSLADVAVVVVEQIGPAFGECVVMLDCVGVKSGYIVVKGYTTPDHISQLTKDTVLENYEFVPDDLTVLRERLLAQAKTSPSSSLETERTGSVPVDHFFDVKGVGTVVLGCVVEGVVRRHDSVRVLPSGKEAEIRSIQKHDDDYESAVKGDRVGLALKGVSVSDLDRGTVLSNDNGLIARDTIEADAHLVKYWLNPLTEGMVLHIGHWMQFVQARVESVNPSADWRNPRIKLRLNSDLVYPAGSRAVMTYLEGGKLRVVGTVDLK